MPRKNGSAYIYVYTYTNARGLRASTRCGSFVARRAGGGRECVERLGGGGGGSSCWEDSAVRHHQDWSGLTFAENSSQMLTLGPPPALSLSPAQFLTFPIHDGGARVGRFDFRKFSQIFAPSVSIILACILKDLGEIAVPIKVQPHLRKGRQFYNKLANYNSL